MTLTGEPGTALTLLDEAEALDPFLPAWCVEERGVALYSLGRYQEALEALGKLVFQTYRSRLYRPATLVALHRPQEPRVLVKEAVNGRPNLTTSSFLFRERYRDGETRSSFAVAFKMLGCRPSQPMPGLSFRAVMIQAPGGAGTTARRYELPDFEWSIIYSSAGVRTERGPRCDTTAVR